MAEHTINDEAITKAAEEFEKQVIKAGPDQTFFCACWPCADKLLQLLIKVAGIDPKLKAILQKIDDALNKAFKASCTQQR